MLAAGLDRTHGGFQVAQVVERIEDAEDIDTVVRRPGDETLDDVIGVMPIPQQVLPAQQHLQRRVGHRLLEGAQALPGIFLEKAHAGIEGRTAPYLERVIADRIQLGTGRQHVLGAQTRGDQGLVAVAQHDIGDFDLGR